MSKRIVSSLLMIAALLAFAGIAAAAEPQKAAPKAEAAAAKNSATAPALTLVEPLKDFGTVAKGEKINWDFVVRNTGKTDLEILSAQPSCGCTVANFDKTVKPGQTGKVSAHIDTTAFSGPISKSITIQTNDPNTPSAQLTLNAIVKPYVEAYPAGFVRYSILQGDTGAQVITLYSEEDEPFQITGIDVPGDWVKVDYKKIEADSEKVKAGKLGQNQYAVKVVYGGPDTKLGPIAEKVRIKTNSKHQPEYMLSLSGVVRPTYSVTPTVLNFGDVAPTDPAATRTIVVKSNDLSAPQLFQVTKVESSLATVSAQVKPTEKPGEFQVTAAVAGSAKEGPLDGTLKIYTSDKTNPVITLPVRGAVKAADAKTLTK